jgi:hypothetical protein
MPATRSIAKNSPNGTPPTKNMPGPGAASQLLGGVVGIVGVIGVGFAGAIIIGKILNKLSRVVIHEYTR